MNSDVDACRSWNGLWGNLEYEACDRVKREGGGGPRTIGGSSYGLGDLAQDIGGLASSVGGALADRYGRDMAILQTTYSKTSIFIGKYKVDVFVAVGGVVVCAISAGVGCVIITVAAGTTGAVASAYRNGLGNAKDNQWESFGVDLALNFGSGAGIKKGIESITDQFLISSSRKPAARSWNRAARKNSKKLSGVLENAFSAASGLDYGN